MTFITVSDNREQLALLSRLLVTVLPGCTIHQSRDTEQLVRHVSCKKVDAVFVDADALTHLLRVLQKQKIDTRIWALCKQDATLPEETAGLCGVLSYPITEQKMRSALQGMPH